jgi:hypothetical protein
MSSIPRAESSAQAPLDSAGKKYRDKITALFKGFAGQGRTLVIPRPYIDFCKGDHLAALLLSQILFWSERTDNPDGWFTKSYKEWDEELGLTQYQVKRAMNGDKRAKKGHPGLIALGVECELRRSSHHKGAATLHYRINESKLRDAILDFMGITVINNVHNGDINIVHNVVPNNVDNVSIDEPESNKDSYPAFARQHYFYTPLVATLAALPPPKTSHENRLGSDPLYAMASRIWKTSATGFLNNVTAMLRGQSTTGQWQVCNLETPLDADTLLGWAKWYRNTNPNLNLPEKPDTIQKWICKYQAQPKPRARGGILDMSDIPPDHPDYQRIEDQRMKALMGWAS